MGRARGLLFAFTFLFVTQLSLPTSSAQSALIRALNASPVSNLETSTAPALTLASPSPDAESKIPSTTTWMPEASALSSSDPKKLGLIDRAYLDVFTILNDDNECSRLFGGKFAIAALNTFVRQLKPTYLDRHVAIRMSGTTTTMQSNRTGFTFRVFDKAELNLSGSFFRNTGHSKVTSEFQPNTRETRAVVLLHELGHMVKSADDDGWLLPDDGVDRALSIENTRTVVDACRKQITSVSKLSLGEELNRAGKEGKG
jgi:hypothetical protein